MQNIATDDYSCYHSVAVERCVEHYGKCRIMGENFVQKLKMTYYLYDRKFGQEFYGKFQSVFRIIVNFQ